MAFLEEDVTEQSKVIFEIYTADAIAVCVNELGLKMPLFLLAYRVASGRILSSTRPQSAKHTKEVNETYG
jgi:hypothetical protein